MIEKLFRSPRVRRRMAASQLGIILHRFALDLHARGHALGSIQSYGQIAEHFSRWLARRRVSLCQIDDAVVENSCAGTAVRKDGADQKPIQAANDEDPGNPTIGFHGEKRCNDPHQSTTDPGSVLYRKAKGKEAKLCFGGTS